MLGSCSGFGELALLYSSPRAASVLAITDCKLWVMERAVYMAIKRTYQEQLAALKRKMVASVPILAVLSEVLFSAKSLWQTHSVDNFIAPQAWPEQAHLHS